MQTVKELLQDVDYSYNPSYVPSDFAMKVVNFIKLMTDGKGEASPTPVIHYRMLDALPYPSTDIKKQRIANLAARGLSKTSIFAEILFFYIAVFGKIDNFGDVSGIIYVSDTMENGVRSLKKSMEARYESSDFLKKYIPKAIFNEGEIYLTNIDGRKTGIRMFGAQSGIRGTKIFAKRPQLAVLDDLLSDKNAKSAGIISGILDMIYKGVDNALDPTKRKIIFNGTPFSRGDPLYSAIESDSWFPNVYPVCEKFPCTKDEFKGAWEERFSFEFIEGQYNAYKETGQLNAFYQELMLDINSDSSTLVDETDVNWYSREQILKNKNNYNFYVTTDFATSEAKSADFSAISVWAINNKGHYFWFDGILARQTMDKNIDDLFRLCQKYQPLSVGIEINGTQNGFIPWIRQQMLERNQFFTLAKTIGTNGKPSKVGILSSTSKSKLERFNVMLPDIKNGKLWLPTDGNPSILTEITEELYSVTSRGILSKHDDWLDTFSMLQSMQVLTSSTDVTFVDEYDDVYNKYWIHNEPSSLNNYIV